jgi:tetratricopeptide (TPR) repeat protein
LSAKAQREYERGTRLLTTGNAQASIEHFLRVVEERPRYYGPYHNLAMAYFHLGQYDAAARNFQKSIDLAAAGYAPSLYGLAMVLYSKEQFAQAEALALRAFVLEPSAAGKICLGMVQFALGHLLDAERSARDAIQLNPALAEAWFLLATIHDRQHNPSAVVGDIQTYLKLAPRASARPAAQALVDRAQQALSFESASRH